MCIISNIDQSLRNVPMNWKTLDYYSFFFNGTVLSVFNLIDGFNRISCESTKRPVTAVHSLAAVCLCGVVVGKKKVYL